MAGFNIAFSRKTVASNVSAVEGLYAANRGGKAYSLIAHQASVSGGCKAAYKWRCEGVGFAPQAGVSHSCTSPRRLGGPRVWASVPSRQVAHAKKQAADERLVVKSHCTKAWFRPSSASNRGQSSTGVSS
jgi:hypothetical protein